MANVGYKIQSLSSNALTASATRTVVGVKSGAAFGLQVVKWGFSFNGSAAAAGIECQLVYSTWATNAPGTASTSITATQDYGRVLTNGITGAGHWTTEPTALTVIESKFIQQSGAYEWSVPARQGARLRARGGLRRPSHHAGGGHPELRRVPQRRARLSGG
jgi:hypothetical protein